VQKVRQIVFAFKSEMATKEDIKRIQEYNQAVNASLVKLQNGICLVFDSGSGRDPGIKKIIVKLPDGETAEFSVEKNCDKSSPLAIWVKCEKKNNTYIVKKDDKFLPALKMMELSWVREFYMDRTIAR
jgi:hypothetical protein